MAFSNSFALAGIGRKINLNSNKIGQYNIALDPLYRLKQGVWLYFFLLIFEGALRKWVLPGLATPLLIVRDPIALWLILTARSKGLLRPNLYLVMMTIITVIGIITAITFGHGNLFVAIYGARILLIHFPLIFVIGRVFTRDDVIRLGKVVLWISIPMTLLVFLQFYSPQSAWVNRGIGGDMEGGGFNGGAFGYFRPPGTFSFTNGNVLFYSFEAAFVFYFWLASKSINRLVLIAATFALLIAIPLSISRSLLFQVIISLVFLVAGISRKPEYLGKLIGACIVGVLVFAVISKTTFFQTSTMVFSTRFEGANESEGGLSGVLGERFLGGMLKGIFAAPSLPFWGYGLGIGTSVGGTLLLGIPGLAVSEDEWGRIIAEMGSLLGLLIIFLRVGVFLKIAIACYKKLTKGDLLPWMITSIGLANLPTGQWAQPASLGFGVLIGGLMLASLNTITK